MPCTLTLLMSLSLSSQMVIWLQKQLVITWHMIWIVQWINENQIYPLRGLEWLLHDVSHMRIGIIIQQANSLQQYALRLFCIAQCTFLSITEQAAAFMGQLWELNDTWPLPHSDDKFSILMVTFLILLLTVNLCGIHCIAYRLFPDGWWDTHVSSTVTIQSRYSKPSI